MANPRIIVRTPNPTQLIVLINTQIENGGILTWDIHTKEPSSFTHNPTQWNEKGFVQAKINSETIDFSVFIDRAVKKEDQNAVRAVYVGRFIEMLFAHFPERMEAIAIHK